MRPMTAGLLLYLEAKGEDENMRIFKDPMEMIREVERDMWEMGIRVPSHSVQDVNVENNPDYEAVELHGYGYVLTNWNDVSLKHIIEYMNGNYEWALYEFNDRMSVSYINPGTAWNKWSEVWGKFIHFERFQYTYNQRIRDQLQFIIGELKKHPYTRQAIITIYDKHMDMDNMGGKARIPCSMYYQFLYRQDKLDIIYTMRSCDFLTHFAHDVFFACRMVDTVAEILGLKVGSLTHFVGSIHAFQKDLKVRGIF